jgi:hypothetical protein
MSTTRAGAMTSLFMSVMRSVPPASRRITSPGVPSTARRRSASSSELTLAYVNGLMTWLP